MVPEIEFVVRSVLDVVVEDRHSSLSVEGLNVSTVSVW